MTMINERPPEVETKAEAGHWEGDLIVGVGSASAMVTLRERKTHYGIIINLPHGHTAAQTNQAIIAAFSPLPAHLTDTDLGPRRGNGPPPGISGRHRTSDLLRRTIQPLATRRESKTLMDSRANTSQKAPISPSIQRTTSNRSAELNTRPRKSLGYLTPAASFRAEKRKI